MRHFPWSTFIEFKNWNQYVRAHAWCGEFLEHKVWRVKTYRSSRWHCETWVIEFRNRTYRDSCAYFLNWPEHLG